MCQLLAGLVLGDLGQVLLQLRRLPGELHELLGGALACRAHAAKGGRADRQIVSVPLRRTPCPSAVRRFASPSV
eukprot:3625449-Pyramimonas_sp.AAC.1